MKLHGPQTDRNRLWNAAGDSQRADLSSQRETEQVRQSHAAYRLKCNVGDAWLMWNRSTRQR